MAEHQDAVGAATRSRALEAALIAVLPASGAVDVEIVRAGAPRRGATCAVVTVDPPSDRRDAGRRRVALRLVDALRSNVVARREAAGLRRSGYRIMRVPWELRAPLSADADADARRLRQRLRARVRSHVLVAGYRSAEATLLDEAVANAREASPVPVPSGPFRVLSGVLVAVGEDAVLRVALGPARLRVAAERAVLEHLRSTVDDDRLHDLLPEPVCHGEAGQATWSVQRRLPGAPSGTAVTPEFLTQCLAALHAFHRVPAKPGRLPIMEDATTVAGAVGGDLARPVLALGERAQQLLLTVPSGWGHGDFWHGNLLSHDGELSGIVDWDGAGEHRPPFLDLMHLLVNAARRPGSIHWGPAVAGWLLPWARRGGDHWARQHAQAIGWEPSPGELRDLVVVYWLDRLAYQLRHYADRAERSRWLDRSVRPLVTTLNP